MHMVRWILPLVAAAPLCAVDFQKEVRPILSDACFSCHGFDAKTRMAGLRLDTKEGAFAARKSGTPIVAGNPQASLVYQRIMSPAGPKRMPPEHSHKTLSAGQKETLRRWIAEGAPWKEHWSFTPPVRPALPAVRQAAWVKNPIDRFVLARLEAAALTPAAPADRRTLARRVALDLTGLPPTPADVEAFVRDNAPGAYERLVDRLLATPQYGEHRARYWLDAARYGDTHGIHVDNYREMWPYRDWVIRAFNANQPFDRFTIEQIAGDILPNRTREQQVASGFHRCGVSTSEAGSIDDEVLAMYAKDRVDTTGAVFLGLTIGCATCHDHKFDPILQRDFYSMSAYFRNVSQEAMDGNIAQTPPVIVVPAKEDEARWDSLPALIETRKAAVKSLRSNPWQAGEVTHTTPLEVEAEVALDQVNALLDGRKSFTIAVTFQMPSEPGDYGLLGKTDREKKTGLQIDIDQGIVIARLAGKDGEAVAVVAPKEAKLAPGSWNYLAMSYEGSLDGGAIVLHLNGRPGQRGNIYRKVKGTWVNEAPFRYPGDGRREFKGGKIAELRVFRRVLRDDEAQLVRLWSAVQEAAAKPEPQRSEADRDALHLYRLVRHDAQYQAAAAELAQLEFEQRTLRRRSPTTLVMDQKPGVEPSAHILYRGAYDQPREKVAPATPRFLPALADAPRDRMGLAQWLVAPENPLVARVAVNRFWQEVFGTGLVKTADDFGAQGEAPSHPELLDWLAVEFRESGWDVKKLVRMMVLSNTYQQAAIVTPAKRTKDPENRLLSRGPRFRMDAEMVRDYALAVSGLLVPKIGGPSVKPYQPEGIWETVAMLGSDTRFYTRDSGENLYRRSLYTFLKRSAPPPSMEAFNAPTRETCTVRRERTNTPLQALVTMNDVQFVEAARVLAERTLAAPDPLTDLGSRVLQRSWTPAERAILERAWRDFRAYYRANPEAAQKLIHAGESRPDPARDPAELAATTMLANQILNLDEVLSK